MAAISLLRLTRARQVTVNATATRLQDMELEWLRAQVAGANKARTILLSHHPLFSALEDINGKPVNDLLLQQVHNILPHITAWFWGTNITSWFTKNT